MINYEDYSFDISPNKNFKDFIDEEDLNIIFPKSFDNFELIDDINTDNLYYLNINKQKNNKCINNNFLKTEEKVKGDNNLLILDDYESFYKKFAEKNEVNVDSDDNDETLESDYQNFDNEDELVFSLVEDENLIKIESTETKKSQNEKIFLLSKEKNNSKKKTQNIFRKPRTKRRNKKTKIYKSDKCFPFQYRKGIILYSEQKIESLYSSNSKQGNIYSTSPDSSSTSNRDFSPGNDNDEEKINTEENNNNNPGKNKEEFKKYKSREESNSNDKVNNISDIFMFKFKTKKYVVGPNGKKKKVKKKRKYKPDDIRKKIKARFHKTIKNIINENLKKAGSKELFDFFPQCFIGNISKKLNSACFELTYKELLSTNFIVELNKEGYKNSKVDQNKYKKNLRVLNYLENNPEICRRSGFDLIKDRKYKEILSFYFSSAQFENSLIQLKAEKESPEYIQEYINKAKTYISFYSNANNNDEKDNEKDFEEEKDA